MCAVQPVGNLDQPKGAADEGNSLMTLGDEVPHGQLAAEDVIDSDGTLFAAGRLPVDQDYWRPSGADSGKSLLGVSDRSDEDAADAQFLEEVQAAQFLVGIFLAAAKEHRETIVIPAILNTAGNISEEWVTDVEHDETDCATRARAELPRRLVSDETKPVYHRSNTFSGVRSDEIGAIEDVGDRAD